MKKTKIICTMGPNTDDEEMMRKLVKAGMDYITRHQRTGDPHRYSGRRTESISGRRKPVYTDNGTDRGK